MHRLTRALEQLDAVRWAEVNAITGRVAVAFDRQATPLSVVVQVVEGVEEAHGLRRMDERHPEWDTSERADHPSDVEPVHRTIAGLVGNTLALGLSVVGRIIRAPRFPVQLPGLASAVEGLPSVRHPLERVVGERVVDLVLPLATAAANGVAQGALGIVVDTAHQLAVLGELQARRRVWERREPEFYAEHSEEPIDAPALAPRPLPLPQGPVEQWTGRISLASLVGSAATLAVTADPGRASDVLLAGLPKAAHLGREGFATHLGRSLASRGVVPLDGSALRRLDRVDTVVLDTATLLTGGVEIETIVPFDDTPPDTLRRAAERLVDPDQPTAQRRRGAWTLAPSARPLPRRARAQAAALRQVGRIPLVLSRDGEPSTLVGLAAELDPGAEGLVRAVHRAGFRLLLAGRNGRLHRRIASDALIPAGQPIGAAIRLQAQGAVVAAVVRQGTTGLAAADVGINVARPSGRPSWGGDLLCSHDLADASFLIEACVVAAEVSRRSARFALVGSCLAAAAALAGGPGAGRRCLAVVNGAAAVSLVAGTWSGRELDRRHTAHRPSYPPLRR